MRRQTLTRTLLTALLAFAVLAPGADASAKPRGRTGLHNARYCEILELRGTIPDAKVTVWNTIGLNKCPAAKWDAFDATELAQERGDTLVILNGPRHWLMDSASGRTGQIHSFHGLKLRKVATIPIRSSADLVRATYTEREIDRTNNWYWKSGRRVFELLAPDGSDYVMQSYSQIVDPNLKIGQLPSLGARLTLPQGWVYRSRVLKRPLTLKAAGSTTIIQDDLTDTYQLEPPNPNAPTPKRHAVHVAGVTRETGSPGPGMIEDQGTISGAPFGVGTADLVVTFAPDSKVTGTFELDSKLGSAFGTIAMSYVISGNEITFDGTADITGGTGAYRGIVGASLRAHDHNTLDGQNGTFTMDGSATY